MEFAIGAANKCYPCVCAALDSISGIDVCSNSNALTVVPAVQPVFKNQCSANEFMLNRLKGLNDSGNTLSF